MAITPSKSSSSSMASNCRQKKEKKKSISSEALQTLIKDSKLIQSNGVAFCFRIHKIIKSNTSTDGGGADNQEHQTRAATSYLDDVPVGKKYRILPANTKHCTLNVCLTNVTLRLIPASFYTF